MKSNTTQLLCSLVASPLANKEIASPGVGACDLVNIVDGVKTYYLSTLKLRCEPSV